MGKQHVFWFCAGILLLGAAPWPSLAAEKLESGPQPGKFFEIRTESFDHLRNDGFPKAILAKLKPLGDKIFATEKEYLSALGKVLTEEEFDVYKPKLDHYAAVAKTIPGSFQCWMVNGPRSSRFHSVVTDFGLNPVVLVFAKDVDEADKSLIDFLKQVDLLMGKHADARTGCCVIVLNDGGFRAALEDEAEDYSKRLAETAKVREDQETKLKHFAKTAGLEHVVFALDKPTGPPDYKLDDSAQFTILVYDKHVILGSYAFAKDQFTEKDATRIAKEVATTVLEVERLSRPKKRRR